MVMAKLLFQRVADEARPPAILGRPGCGPPDYFTEVLLDDLVKSGAWLDLELKRPFLALWVNDEDFDFPDWNDPFDRYRPSECTQIRGHGPSSRFGIATRNAGVP